jgi:hypothetical protein
LVFGRSFAGIHVNTVLSPFVGWKLGSNRVCGVSLFYFLIPTFAFSLDISQPSKKSLTKTTSYSTVFNARLPCACPYRVPLSPIPFGRIPSVCWYVDLLHGSVCKLIFFGAHPFVPTSCCPPSQTLSAPSGEIENILQDIFPPVGIQIVQYTFSGLKLFIYVFRNLSYSNGCMSVLCRNKPFMSYVCLPHFMTRPDSIMHVPQLFFGVSAMGRLLLDQVSSTSFPL